MITIGQKVADFTLNDQTEEKVSLSDFSGQWVVLYFYPRDNTPGCTTEALEFTALAPEFENLKATILGISPDSCASHQKFVLKHHLGITLLSDPQHQVLENFAAWGEKKIAGKSRMGVIRSTVIIDPQGMLVFHWPKVKAKGHAVEVKQKLMELQK